MRPFIAAIDSGLTECFSDLAQTLHGLTVDEVNFRPTLESNTISWLVWHKAKTEDYWVNFRIRQSEMIWDEERWGERLGIDSEGTGFGQTREDVLAFPRVHVGEVMGYYSRVREGTTRLFASWEDEGILERVVTHPSGDESLSADLTWVLGHLLCEQAQHLGQIDYLRGIMRGINK